VITKPTVYILGAGASVPYGFPVGAYLVGRIATKGLRESNERHFAELGFCKEIAVGFMRELNESRQASIDAFLEYRKEYIPIGKAAIATFLIEAEHDNNLFTRNWYDTILERMAGKNLESFATNRVTFVTFNYDRSLEHFFHSALKARYGKSSEEVAAVLKKIEIIRVHGQLGFLPWQAKEATRGYNNRRTTREIEIAANGINIISDENVGNSTEFENAKSAICVAERIAFLGFGFHELNMRRLLFPRPNEPRIPIHGTCKGLSQLTISALSAKYNISLAYETINEFLNNEPLFQDP
jgi:hypothetical protein